jgi:penicillin amidase
VVTHTLPLKLRAARLAAAIAIFGLAACGDDETPKKDMNPPADMADMADMTPDDGTPDQGDDMPDQAPDMVDMSDMSGPDGPFKNLKGKVTVYRDAQGMPHIFAEYVEDAFFINGYLHAEDRLLQLEFYRRIATGRLAELAGVAQPSTISFDALLRTLGLKRNAERIWQETDKNTETAQIMTAYAQGINAYLSRWRAGKVQQSGVVTRYFQPTIIDDWSEADTLAIGKLLALELTYVADLELELTDVRQKLLTKYNAAAANEADRRRAGIINDLLRTGAATEAKHIDGWPNLTGQALRAAPNASKPPAAPPVADELIANALRLHRALEDGPFKHLNPLPAKDRRGKGSNNWTVRGELTESGHPMVANDPHLSLTLPTVFYPLHISVKQDKGGKRPIEFIGASYVGVPGVVIGRTDKLAWGTTVGYYDYVDLYQEQITGASNGANPATVLFNGQQVATTRIVEKIKIGALGIISDEVDMTVEIVPHHGPILPTFGPDGKPAVRTGDRAISVRWVGAEPKTNELDFLIRLWRAQNPAEVEVALDFYEVGSSNFVFGFTSGDIFYSGQSRIPVRDPRALAFDPITAPDAAAPVFVLPGTGEAEWTGDLAEEKIPHALNPERGYVITANNDQVGTTFDNNPFNDAHYLGAIYDLGFRAARIEELIERAKNGGPKLNREINYAIQNDGMDTVARRVVPHMTAALDQLLDATVLDTDDPELAEMRAVFATETVELTKLRDLLKSWDYMAPATQTPTDDDVVRSAATTLFNVAMVFLYREVYADELRSLGYVAPTGELTFPQISQILTRSILFLLEQPEAAQTRNPDGVVSNVGGTITRGDSWLFDDMDTATIVEGRRTMLIRSLLLARDRLASQAAFGEYDMRPIASPRSQDWRTWVWGKLHGLRLAGLTPLEPDTFFRPKTGATPFFERPGGEFAVSPCNHGYDNFNMTCGSGSSLRMVHILDPAGPKTWNVIPGGASADPAAAHYDDQLANWNANQAHELLWDEAAIKTAAASTVEFTADSE